MRGELLQLAADLARDNVAFVIALVVAREPASSAQIGNMAVITESGEFHGWLGGSCIRPTIQREAAAALTAGAPRLISLSPDPEGARRAGVTTFPMTCHSGGAVEIYLEPVMPAPRLLVFGLTPVARALVRLGKAMGYAVDAVDPEGERDAFPEADRLFASLDPATIRNRPASLRNGVFAVIATQGHRDEEAVMEALLAEPGYVAVVASRERFRQVRETLTASGVPGAVLDSIRNPAGLDINAKAPEEIALSILAEIVKERRAKVQVGQAGHHEVRTSAGSAESRTEIDPICGMTVAVATARYTAQHEGHTYYFCCGGCKQTFLAAPEQYMPSRGAVR